MRTGGSEGENLHVLNCQLGQNPLAGAVALPCVHCCVDAHQPQPGEEEQVLQFERD